MPIDYLNLKLQSFAGILQVLRCEFLKFRILEHHPSVRQLSGRICLHVHSLIRFFDGRSVGSQGSNASLSDI